MSRLILALRVALDLLVMTGAFWLAYLFRFEFSIPRIVVAGAVLYWPIVLVAHYAGLLAFRVTRLSWRYLNMRDSVHVLAGVFAPTALLVLLRLTRVLPTFSGGHIPLSVLAMNFVLLFLGLVGVRASRRLWAEGRDRRKLETQGVRHRVLLIGAGEAGVIVSRELKRRPDLGLQPVGFIDDDPLKTNTVIGGLPVLGKTSDIARIADYKRVKRALITIANAPGETIRRITETCRDAGVDAKIIPGIYEIVGDKVNLSRLREVAIEDLLGREPVKLDEDIVGDSIRSRVVIVTGAGGSIGSELCRQICRFGPARLVLLERFENALFEIHRELGATYPGVLVEPCVGDVSDVRRMTRVFEQFKPEIVFHAAAHKHVPMMEWNAGEAVKNNVGGTRITADLAHQFGVQRFVLVSTDKAVNPTSVMGATKRVAEIYLQAMSQRSSTKFVTVRFGNVLGSAGSVVPIFREQIAKGGPVMVTHPDMRRYFMTIAEASRLVLQAGAMGQGGEIFILDMGEPVKIVDLARDLITLSGLRPDEDIEIRFSGVRPGEKLFEELSTAAEVADNTRHPKVFVGRIKPHQWEPVAFAVEQLLGLANDSADLIRGALGELVPEYAVKHPASTKTTAPRGEQAVREGATVLPAGDDDMSLRN